MKEKIRNAINFLRELLNRFWVRSTVGQRAASVAAFVLIVSFGGYQLYLKSKKLVHNILVAKELRIEGESPPFRIFAADPAALNLQGPLLITPQQEVSILKPFAVVAVFDQLETGKRYFPEIIVRDSSGEKIPFEPCAEFTAKNPQDAISVVIAPNRKNHKPGEWTTEVILKDIGTISANLMVLPPDAAETASLMRSEKARERVFEAFGYYWLGLKDQGKTTYLTAARPSPKEIEDAEQARIRKKQNRERMAVEAPVEDQSEYDEFALRIGHPGLKPASDKDEQEYYRGPKFIQIANPRYKISENPLSDADGLNGITYRGTAAFSFELFRFFQEGSGWTPWTDSARPQSDLGKIWGHALQAASKTFNIGPNAANNPQLGGLRFEFYEQEGGWFVTSDQGDRFINGVRKGVGTLEQLQRLRPTLLDVQIFQPDETKIKELMQSSPALKNAAAQLSAEIDIEESVPNQQSVGTKALLRGN